MSDDARLRLRERGEFFATRRIGQQIYDDAAALLDTDPGRRLVLDFDGVQAITVTFADEVVANLVADYGTRIVVAGTNHEVAEAVVSALTRRAL
jgi:hypothetical protein